MLPEDTHNKLDAIKANNPTDVKECCTEMFKEWLEVDTDASWDKLIVALRQIKKRHLAETINSCFQGNCVSTADYVTFTIIMY